MRSEKTEYSNLFKYWLNKRLNQVFLSLTIGLGALGCQAPAKINNVTLSLQTIRRAILSQLPQGIKEESLNGRELRSGFFNPKNWEEDATDKPERAYAKVLVLESGRPYRIDVHVFREKKDKTGKYAKPIDDRILTRKLVNRLKEALADRREDRNVIDDFRAF